DAVREDLPASVAADVVLTVHRPGAPDERIPLQIDESGESWVGSGRPVDNPAAATVRVAFSIRHEPHWIALPFRPPPVAPATPRGVRCQCRRLRPAPKEAHGCAAVRR